MINLANLGYNFQITYAEEFSPNNKNKNEAPEEFLIYPVDEISNIYKPYRDEIYDRFIKEAKDIMEKYNKIDGECNPDNKYLYFETDECDNIIEKGHGGYLCGTDGKWNTSNCIISYCDDGYILSDNRTQCFKNPCLNIEILEIEINDENYTEYIIQPNTIHKITFQNTNNSYSVSSETEGIFFQSYIDMFVIPKENNSIFGPLNILVINYYLNLTKNTTVYIKKIENTTENNATNDETDQTNDETEQTNDETDQTNDNESRNAIFTRKKKSIAAWKISLIIVGSIVALLIFVVALFLTMKKTPQVVLPEQNESAKGIQI